MLGRIGIRFVLSISMEFPEFAVGIWGVHTVRPEQVEVITGDISRELSGEKIDDMTDKMANLPSIGPLSRFVSSGSAVSAGAGKRPSLRTSWPILSIETAIQELVGPAQADGIRNMNSIGKRF